jgi:predicted HicB family RNase H-like nuclease
MEEGSEEKASIIIRVDKKLAERIKEAAKKDGRSVSNWGGRVFEEKLKEMEAEEAKR